MTKVLVTGGAGFIGSAIVRSYAGDGSSVAVIDDLSSGRREALPATLRLVEMNIADRRVADTIRELAPEVIIHAAAQVSVTRSITDPQLDFDVNVGGTRNVVAGALAVGARIVFTSSGGAVYGEADGATEDDPPSPMSPYGRNKLLAETMVAASGLPYANARLANVYGPGQRAGLEGGVVAIFTDAALAGAPLLVYGDGEQSRDFVFVDDVVEAVRRLASHERSGTWNVGTGTSTSVHALIASLEDAFARPIRHEHRTARPGEVYRSRLSIDRIGADIGWKSRTSLVEGLSRTLAARERGASERADSR